MPEPASIEHQSQTGGGVPWKPIALVVVIVALFAAGRYLPLQSYLTGLRGWIDGLGPWGPVAYGMIYVLWTVFALPGSAITVIAGAVFGAVWGTVIVSIASTAGAAAAFLIARYIARDAVKSWLASKPKFQRLDQMTERQGAIIVALTRLVPIFPFNLLNYGFGLTRVRFWTYVFWSWTCMLPGTILYVAGTDAVVQAVAEGRVPWLAVGLAVLGGIILFLLVRQARSRLQEVDPEQSNESS